MKTRLCFFLSPALILLVLSFVFARPLQAQAYSIKRSWHLVASVSRAQPYNTLTSVAAFSKQNVWAVGYSEDASQIDQALIEHWNGKVWSIVRGIAPCTANTTSLNAITSIPKSSHLWAVGDYTRATDDNQFTLTESYW